MYIVISIRVSSRLVQSLLTARKGTYRIMKCNDMLRITAPQRYGLAHGGSVRRDSFSESELRALAISIVTKIDSDTVVARLDISLTNIWQPISGNCDEHAWKCVS